MIKKIAAGPYMLWMAIFIVVPIMTVVYFSFTHDIYSPEEGITFIHYMRSLESLYRPVWLRSFSVAIKSTLICLLLGYPMAFILSRMSTKYRTMAVMLLVVPMWMNFLLRTYAWRTILGRNGFLNQVLSAAGLPVVDILFTETAVLLGMVYNFLPFMILPIYTALTKMNTHYIEAARDLGANQWLVFRKVILPLSFPGIVSGVAMVFMPSVSTFVIADLLGGGQYLLIGNIIESQINQSYNQNFASALALILMVVILLSMGFMNHLSKKYSGSEEGALW